MAVESEISQNVTLETGDLQIGAVEVKNSTDDTRATVGANGLQVDVRAIVAIDTELPAAGALADGASATPTTPTVGAVPLLMNATTEDRQRAVVNALDSVGTGIAAAGLVGQFDDTATGAVTENQFAPVRISSRRAVLVEGVSSGTAVTVDTELPAATAMADAVSNPTLPGIAAYLVGWNGTTWDRVKVDGQRNLQARLTDSGGTPLRTEATLTDGYGPGGGASLLGVMSIPYLFNETTWDQRRNNVGGTLLVSAARVATTSSSDQTNFNGRGGVLFVDFTATPNNTETFTLSIEEKDPVSGKYVPLTAFTALTSSTLGATPTTETYMYTLYPGALETVAVAKHEVNGLVLSRTWRATGTHSAAGSWTYSIGYAVIL